MDEYRFNMYMRDLLSEKAKDIIRCKGVLCVQVSVGGSVAWAGGAVVCELSRGALLLAVRQDALWQVQGRALLQMLHVAPSDRS